MRELAQRRAILCRIFREQPASRCQLAVLAGIRTVAEEKHAPHEKRRAAFGVPRHGENAHHQIAQGQTLPCMQRTRDLDAAGVRGGEELEETAQLAPLGQRNVGLQGHDDGFREGCHAGGVVAVAMGEQNGLDRVAAQPAPSQRRKNGVGLAIIARVDQGHVVVIDVDDEG